ncbi:transcription termination/antitermination factor NusG [Candidatus Marinamargulisbacteria bacterium SCGC AG-414-C22]|nr:transcription termination/antitermination factor NusG [Candidatus Marinamargulisbacteria bacterium SCGC AG-414-C22]
MNDIEKNISEDVVESENEDLVHTEDSSENSVEEQDTSNEDWYIIQTYSSQEYKVRSRIETFIEEARFKETLFRVLVPEQESIEIKNNKRTEKLSKIFPGYVFIQMKYEDELSFAIKSIPGVSKFVGAEGNAPPFPVQEDEILKVLRKIGDKTKEIDIDFEVGEVIKIIAGPFRGYSGSISEINPVKGKLKSLISIFGRETPVELDFDQVEKTI